MNEKHNTNDSDVFLVDLFTDIIASAGNTDISDEEMVDKILGYMHYKEDNDE